jgi:hypothetical protein
MKWTLKKKDQAKILYDIINHRRTAIHLLLYMYLFFIESLDFIHIIKCTTNCIS